MARPIPCDDPAGYLILNEDRLSDKNFFNRFEQLTEEQKQMVAEELGWNEEDDYDPDRISDDDYELYLMSSGELGEF